MAGQQATCPHCGQLFSYPVPQAIVPFVPDEPGPVRPVRALPRQDGDTSLWTIFAVGLVLGLIVGIAAWCAIDETGAVRSTTLLIALAAGGVVIYLIPCLVASARRHNQAGAITALNVLLGWSFIAWVICLVWALTSDVSPPHHHHRRPY